MAAKLLSLSLGLLLAASCRATPTTTTPCASSTSAMATAAAASASSSAAPAGGPPVLPPLAPFGLNITTSDGDVITCFDITSAGNLVTPEEALAVVQAYNDTICAVPQFAGIQAQQSIVFTLGSVQAVFKNQAPFDVPGEPCVNTVNDFLEIIDKCFNGLPSYGGRLLEAEVINYVIANTVNGPFV